LSCCSEFGFTEWWTTFFHWITNATRDRMMMTPLRPCKDERYRLPCLLFRRAPSLDHLVGAAASSARRGRALRGSASIRSKNSPQMSIR
jgi:hypothetical protein